MNLDKQTIEMLKQVGKIYEDGLREQMNVPSDWRYISTSTSKDAFEKLQNIVGESPVTYVSFGNMSNGTMRFTAFFSPESVQKVTDWKTYYEDSWTRT